jgi:hypothetical protein
MRLFRQLSEIAVGGIWKSKFRRETPRPRHLRYTHHAVKTLLSFKVVIFFSYKYSVPRFTALIFCFFYLHDGKPSVDIPSRDALCPPVAWVVLCSTNQKVATSSSSSLIESIKGIVLSTDLSVTIRRVLLRKPRL